MAMAVCLAALAFPVPVRAQDACFSSLTTGTIADITPHGDIGLATGQNFGLADIALPESEPWRQQALAFLQSLRNQPTTVDFAAKPDRWNRTRAALAMPDGDLAEMLIDRGLAIVDPGEAASLCNAGLLQAERRARDRRAGLWSDDGNRPVAARDTEMLLKRQGRFTLVSGRIVSVGIRTKRTYLNFGRNWKTDFSASIPAALWAKMAATGISADILKGKTVLVRGVIRQWSGPGLELAAPEMLEIY